MKASDNEGVLIVTGIQEQWENVFDAADLELYDQQLQQNWSKNMDPVHMFMLNPKEE